MAKRLKINLDDFAYSNVMERISRAKVKDSIKGEEIMYFILYPGNLRKAIGKNGENLKKAQEKFSMRIKFVEYSDDCSKFIRNFIYPLKVEEIDTSGEEILIKDSNRKTKSLLIGRNARNLKVLNEVVGRYFSKTVKVI